VAAFERSVTGSSPTARRPESSRASAALAADAWTEEDPLTDRERQVLRLAADGQTGSAIAASLQLSEGTVRNYLSEAISKLGAQNRVEAARLARLKGWL
jgi:two-component system response regulator DesR